MLASCAVWAAARLKSEGRRAIIIFWSVFGFAASGFEHVVANMTTFAIGFAHAHVAGKGHAHGAADAADVHAAGDATNSR